MIIQFDTLPAKEKKRRINDAFDYYTMLLKEKSHSKKIEFARESVYPHMRDEFSKYWLQTKDEQLLQKYFVILQLDGAAADGTNEMVAARLFCTAPDDFFKVLNKQPQELKDYVVYCLTSTGIKYYVMYDLPIDTHINEREKKFMDLLQTKLTATP